VVKDTRHIPKADDVPDVRADEPERAMAQFTDGLRRVLSAPKVALPKRRKRKRGSSQP